jgi:predicted RNA-binding protein with PIN domain
VSAIDVIGPLPSLGASASVAETDIGDRINPSALDDRESRVAPGRFTVWVVRWIVDGMNVIGSRPDGWWKDRNGAMVTLVERLDRWASDRGETVTVVFERPPSTAVTSSVIEIAHAPRAAANSADDEIVRLVQADAHPHDIRVVTSDRTLTERVRSLGASVHRSESFRDVVDPRAR